jgi:integrase
MADTLGAELDGLSKASAANGDGDLVFADPFTGGPLNKAAILRRFKKALVPARLPDEHRFHDLRHTFGTRCAAQGLPIRTLQESMGHKDIKTTERYADYAPSAHEAAFIKRAFGATPDPRGSTEREHASM